MSRRSDRPLKKITIRVWEDNWNMVEEIGRLQDIEPNRIIREMLNVFATQSLALARRNIDRLPPPPMFSMDDLAETTDD